MKQKLKWKHGCAHALLALSCMSGSGAALADAGEWSGNLNGQTRYYPQTGERVDEQTYPAAAIQLDYSQQWTDSDLFTASLFARGDSVDDERNLADIRELNWLHSTDAWQFRAGVGQVSWGVNELFKITDVINQKDRAEVPVPRKLGQPLASLSFYWGEDLIELYTLYGLRPAWYPGEEGRLRYPILTDREHEAYDWGATGRWDFAGRWKTRLWDMDLAFSHFYGMTRDPYFIFNYDFNDPLMIPVYEKVNQSSLEWQYAWNEVLLKAEFTYQTGSLEQFESAAGGFEYTFGSVFESQLDLTWYVEGIWDSRDHIDGTLFDHDIGVGARLALNDARDSNLVLGVIADTQYSELLGTAFWTNTFGDDWTLNIIGQYFMANDDRYNPADYLPFFRQLVQENPASQASIDTLLGMLGTVTVGKMQFDQILSMVDQLEQPDYWNSIDVAAVPQTLFDLLRMSDNRQKMNLIERDSYVQIDIYYHF